MASLYQIRAGIEEVIRSKHPALAVYRYVPEQTEAPCVILTLDPEKKSAEGRAFQRGHATYQFQLFVLFNRVSSGVDQEDLDRLIDPADPLSLPNILFNDSTLGLPDTDCWVEGFKGYGGEFIDSGIPQTGAIICLRVETDPSGGT